MIDLMILFMVFNATFLVQMRFGSDRFHWI